MDSNKTIGQRIGEIRTENNETQKQLADALGVKREIVTYWENDTRSIKAEQLARIAKRYNVSADYLLGLSSHKSDDKVLTSVSKYTGLSEEAIQTMLYIKKNYISPSNPLNMVLCSTFSRQFFSLLTNSLDAFRSDIIAGKHKEKDIIVENEGEATVPVRMISTLFEYQAIQTLTNMISEQRQHIFIDYASSHGSEG